MTYRFVANALTDCATIVGNNFVRPALIIYMFDVLRPKVFMVDR